MIWLTWRQFRTQAVAVYGLLVVLAAALVITGQPLPGPGAVQLTSAISTLYIASIVVMYALPALIGIFWGAPLVTRELEAGTHRLVWNQTITRSRWLASKLAVTGLAAAVASGLLSLAVTWWASPIDAAAVPSTIAGDSDAGSVASRISPLVFGARGIVPLGYAVFAFVLGVTAGVLLRRTVLAMALTLAVFVAVQITVPIAVRPYVMPPVDETVTITPANISKLGINGSTGRIEELKVAGPQGAWVLSNETVNAAGQAATLPPWTASCLAPDPILQQQPKAGPECVAKLANLGYRQQITYQPANRFWQLQWIETAVYLSLSALLAALCFRWTRRVS